MADIIFTLIVVGIPSGLLLYTIYCESGMDRAIKKKVSRIKENRRKAAQRRTESRMEQPFAAQQSPWADGKFQKNFRGTDGAYGIGRNGSPLKWKCFEEQSIGRVTVHRPFTTEAYRTRMTCRHSCKETDLC